MIWNGLKYCFGVLEGYWEDGKPRVRAIEPYDILFDPTVKDIRDSSIVIKEVSVPLNKIMANQQYNENKNEIKADGKLSSSGFKEARLAEKHGGKDTGTGKVLIYEAWMHGDFINRGFLNFSKGLELQFCFHCSGGFAAMPGESWAHSNRIDSF